MGHSKVIEEPKKNIPDIKWGLENVQNWMEMLIVQHQLCGEFPGRENLSGNPLKIPQNFLKTKVFLGK